MRGTLNFVLIGGRSAGKTCYLAALGKNLVAGNEPTQKYLKPIIKTLDAGLLPPPNSTEMMQDLSFKIRKDDKTLHFSVTDYGGEFVEFIDELDESHQERKKQFEQNVRESEGLFVFLPFLGSSPSQTASNLADSVDEIIRYAIEIQADAVECLQHIPVVIVVSKWDQSPHFMDENESSLARDYILSNGTYAHILQKFETNFSNVTIVPISSIPKETEQTSQAPHRLQDPIAYAINHTFELFKIRAKHLDEHEDYLKAFYFLDYRYNDILDHNDEALLSYYNKAETHVGNNIIKDIQSRKARKLSESQSSAYARMRSQPIKDAIDLAICANRTRRKRWFVFMVLLLVAMLGIGKFFIDQQHEEAHSLQLISDANLMVKSQTVSLPELIDMKTHLISMKVSASRNQVLTKLVAKINTLSNNQDKWDATLAHAASILDGNTTDKRILQDIIEKLQRLDDGSAPTVAMRQKRTTLIDKASLRLNKLLKQKRIEAEGVKQTNLLHAANTLLHDNSVRISDLVALRTQLQTIDNATSVIQTVTALTERINILKERDAALLNESKHANFILDEDVSDIKVIRDSLLALKKLQAHPTLTPPQFDKLSTLTEQVDALYRKKWKSQLMTKAESLLHNQSSDLAYMAEVRSQILGLGDKDVDVSGVVDRLTQRINLLKKDQTEWQILTDKAQSILARKVVDIDQIEGSLDELNGIQTTTSLNAKQQSTLAVLTERMGSWLKTVNDDRDFQDLLSEIKNTDISELADYILGNLPTIRRLIEDPLRKDNLQRLLNNIFSRNEKEDLNQLPDAIRSDADYQQVKQALDTSIMTSKIPDDIFEYTRSDELEAMVAMKRDMLEKIDSSIENGIESWMYFVATKSPNHILGFDCGKHRNLTLTLDDKKYGPVTGCQLESVGEGTAAIAWREKRTLSVSNKSHIFSIVRRIGRPNRMNSHTLHGAFTFTMQDLSDLLYNGELSKKFGDYQFQFKKVQQ